MNFGELGLNAALLKSLSENNISEPSEIQEKVIPFILSNSKNLIAISQTGTGKTAAFGLPLLQQLEPQLQQTQALIIVPTRELSQQVAKDLFVFSRYIVRIHTEAIIGGRKIEEQLKKIAIPRHIIVATPGRLIDLLERKALDLSYLKFLVLDEADEMLNMGFKADIDKVVKACKPNVRKFLFTSTLPAELKQTVSKYMGTATEEIQVKPQEFVNRAIQHQYIAFKYGFKFEYFKAYLDTHPNERGIIFCRTQAAAKLLGQQLIGISLKVGTLYGKLDQYQRTKVMTAFKANRIQYLIATDVAARGIDVQDLDFVLHYHLPENEAQFVNRSGRTGRAGNKGKSICMLQSDQISSIDPFEKSLGIKFTALTLNPTIDLNGPVPIELTINLGTRQGIDEEKIKDFLSVHSGIKLDAIREVQVYRSETTFVIDTKYKNLVLNNLNNTKQLRQKIVIEESFDGEK